MDRNLALNLARVTESAALAAARYLGRGDKDAADQAAVDAMRKMFDTVDIDGEVVIGEGEIDEAPMLYIGERVGLCEENSTLVDIAVDPLDGTSAIADGKVNAISVIAVGPRGSLLKAPDVYMKKLAVGPKAKGVIDINKSITENIKAVAKALDKDVSEITVQVLDRPRHKEMIDEIRKAGGKVSLIADGDVLACILTCFDESTVDMLAGIGGAPEGVLAAAALKCLGGELQGVLAPSDEAQLERCHKMGIEDLDKVYYMDDFIASEAVIFSATGVSDGDVLEAVKFYGGNIATTDTLVLRSETGTERFIKAKHKLDLKPEYTKIEYKGVII